jgi:hypothetical protein
LRADRSALRKAKLADRIDCPFLLLASIQYLLRNFKPGKPRDSEPFYRLLRAVSPRYKRHLKAAKRLLYFKDYPLTRTLGFKDPGHLRKIGLTPGEIAELPGMSPEVLQRFADFNPEILNLAQAWLKSAAERKETERRVQEEKQAWIEKEQYKHQAPPTFRTAVENLKKGLPIGWCEYSGGSGGDRLALPKDEGIGSVPGVVFG